MSIEVERKFLLKNDDWRKIVTRQEKLQDGLIGFSEKNKVRVRKYENKSTIAVKTKKEHGKRHAFEYEIPNEDADYLLNHHCGIYVLCKTRHYVKYEGLTWEIDEYDGILAGTMIAGVDVTNHKEHLDFPDWVSKEVTDDPRYTKLNMLIYAHKNKSSHTKKFDESRLFNEDWDHSSSSLIFNDDANFEQARQDEEQLTELLHYKNLK